MKVLVACEFSGTVRDAFAARGHDAMSCDLLASEKPGKHYQGSVFDLDLSDFDLMIAHPPCTHLAVSGARWWPAKLAEQAEAVDFVRRLLAAPVKRIALENPVGIITKRIRPADQYIQPWEHGHGETKKTGLWLKCLPNLRPSNPVPGRVARTHLEPPGSDRWARRSRTLPGIAAAMAEQWGAAEHWRPAQRSLFDLLGG